MRIDKTRQDDFARAVDLDKFLTVPLQPGIAQRVFGLSDGNDLPAEAENGAILDDAEFFEVGTAAGSRLA